MDVDHPVREPRQERRREDVQVAGADHDLDALRREPAGHRQIALLARRVILEPEDCVRHARALGTLQGERPGDVACHRDDGQPAVEQRLEVRPRARDEDADQSEKETPATPASTRPMTGTPAEATSPAGTIAQ